MQSKQMRRSRKGFTLVELMMVVAIIGILSTMAMLAFKTFANRARSSEAIMGLEAIINGAKVYWMTEHAAADGHLIPKAFPVNTWEFEDAEYCWYLPKHKCEGGRNGQVPFKDNPSWQALNFAIDDPHNFAYYWDSTSGYEWSGEESVQQGWAYAETFLNEEHWILEMAVRGEALSVRSYPLEDESHLHVSAPEFDD